VLCMRKEAEEKSSAVGVLRPTHSRSRVQGFDRGEAGRQTSGLPNTLALRYTQPEVSVPPYPAKTSKPPTRELITQLLYCYSRYVSEIYSIPDAALSPS
jgi:hypothetical protein